MGTPQRTSTVHLLAAMPWLVAAVIPGCNLESSLNRFGDQLMEQFDNEPVQLVEVRNEVDIPPGTPLCEDLDVPVQPIETPPARYPERLRKKSVEGKATVVFVVDSSGVLVNPQIEYATDTSFASALLEAVRTWRIAPGQRGGVPANCCKKLTIDFMLR
jgi:TonB family protein